ncbi:MAG TPA: iron-sulfur cluster assembly accessory protein [Solimonas sp.]|nr:iron-sulfur cluster assembly accessory protein [Solimonas sp.]
MNIQLTPAAAQRIGTQISRRGKGLGLRVGVKKSGCSGYAYTMDYADEIAPGEQVIEQHGARLVVDPQHLPLLDGLVLDYQKQGLNEAFKFLNPNVKGQCGCGESFTV